MGNLRLTSSGSKVFIQFMMFFVTGVLPLVFPQWIQIKNREIVFVIVTIALISSVLFEIIRYFTEKAGKNTRFGLNIQLLVDVILLAVFLHFFGYINGPFFVLFLLTVMESFLNLNPLFSFTIITIMIAATTGEFIWLAYTGQIVFGFVPLVEYIVRILSLIFISAYGFVLAKTTSELNQANSYLTEMDKIKDEFVANASHELRTPMTSIKSYVWMVLNGKAGPISDTARQYLNTVFESTERLIHLINNMLDISKIESGKNPLHMEPINVSELVNLIYNEFQAKAVEKNMSWEVKLPDSLPLVTADKDKIIQVLENIIGNAFKYTPDAGKITLSVVQKDNFLSFAVTDTGNGISQEDIPHIFTKFTKLSDKFTTFSQPGTGLGLYLSKQYVEKHHGTISVASQVGSGSTFTFTLPLFNINK